MAKKDSGNEKTQPHEWQATTMDNVAKVFGLADRRQDNGSNAYIEGALLNVADELGVTDLPPTASEFAPPDDPARMERTAELCGAAIRAAGKSLAQSILDVAADGLARATSNKVDAEHLAAEILRVADEQATQAEKTMLDMKGTGALFAAEKLRIAESNKANVS